MGGMGTGVDGMRTSLTKFVGGALGALLMVASPAVAQERLQPRPKGEPIFFHWLNPKAPKDRVILEYWSKVKANKATPAEMLDLGTMLYRRGFSGDAIKIYHRTAKAYPNLAEPWFLAGLVEHQRDHLKAARSNYKRCLKLLTGNGWCNFYMGLVEEQLGDPFDAMHYYDRAFHFDPDLANPKVNPEVLKSRLQLGAYVRHLNQEQFAGNMPIHFFEAHGPQGFRLSSAAQRRRALEKPVGAVHRPRKLARPHKARVRRRPAHSRKKPGTHAKGFTPKFVVKGVPAPTPNPNRMPWGSSWKPSKKVQPKTPPKKRSMSLSKVAHPVVPRRSKKRLSTSGKIRHVRPAPPTPTPAPKR